MIVIENWLNKKYPLKIDIFFIIYTACLDNKRIIKNTNANILNGTQNVPQWMLTHNRNYDYIVAVNDKYIILLPHPERFLGQASVITP